MGLKFDPVGGGQFKQVVQQIIEAERQPIKTMENRKQLEQGKLKLFQDFKGKVSNLQKSIEDISTAGKLREFKVDLGDGEGAVAVTLDKERVKPGAYQVEIDQLAARSSMISRGFTDPDDNNLGIGYITFEKPDGSNFELFVDEKNASLRNVASLINSSQGAPVQASVVKDVYDPEKPWKLIVTAKQDGETREVKFPEFYFLDGDEDFWIDDKRAAQNAYLKLDGFDLDIESNDVENFLDGINIHLKQARPDKPFMITIKEDPAKISAKIKTVVDNVNTVLEFINKQNQIDKNSDTRSTFAGDTGLQTMEYRLRNLLHEAFPYFPDPESDEPDLIWLHQMGVTIGKNGMLAFAEDKFNKALEGNFERISEAITGEYGFATQLKNVVTTFTSPSSGLLNLREQGLRSRIQQIDDNISNKERLLDQRAQALTEKFSRLQSTLSNMQRQQAFLQSNLGGGGGGGNLVTQLLGG